MKKIYTKPSLHAEKFAVEDIMTSVDVPTTLSGATSSLFVQGGIGTISFSNFERLNSINFSDFKAKN